MPSLPLLDEMLFMSTSFVHYYESAGAKRKGMATDSWRSAYPSGLIAEPALLGFLMEYYNYNACWIFAGALGIFLFILFFAKTEAVDVWFDYGFQASYDLTFKN